MDSNENEICEITVVELKIKCPSDILTEYINNKTKIFLYSNLTISIFYYLEYLPPIKIE